MAAASLLLLAAAALLISPVLSQNCSHTFSNQTFANCSILTQLNATLRWTYNLSALTLSVAFTVPPAKTGGWVAWGLNPHASGMMGTQALIAFAANGSLAVKKYNITSPQLTESAIDYPVSNTMAVLSGGEMTILATLVLPAAATEVNHTWQVGKTVTKGMPDAHDMVGDNMKSFGVLKLVAGAADAPAGSGPPASVSPGGSPSTMSPGPSGGSSGGNDTAGGSRVWGGGLGLYGVFALICVSNFGF